MGIMTLSTMGHWGATHRKRMEGCTKQREGNYRWWRVTNLTWLIKANSRLSGATVSDSCGIKMRTDLAPKGRSKPSAMPSSFLTGHRPKDQLFSKAVAGTACVLIQRHSILISIFPRWSRASRDHRKFSKSYILSEALNASLVVSRSSSLSLSLSVCNRYWNRTWSYHTHIHAHTTTQTLKHRYRCSIT